MNEEAEDDEDGARRRVMGMRVFRAGQGSGLPGQGTDRWKMERPPRSEHPWQGAWAHGPSPVRRTSRVAGAARYGIRAYDQTANPTPLLRCNAKASEMGPRFGVKFLVNRAFQNFTDTIAMGSG